MTVVPRWGKALVKRSPFLVGLNARWRWKLHLLKDWWGTKIWRKTTEVVTPLGFKLTSGLHPAYALMRTGTFEVEETALIVKSLPQVDSSTSAPISATTPASRCSTENPSSPSNLSTTICSACFGISSRMVGRTGQKCFRWL